MAAVTICRPLKILKSFSMHAAPFPHSGARQKSWSRHWLSHPWGWVFGSSLWDIFLSHHPSPPLLMRAQENIQNPQPFAYCKALGIQRSFTTLNNFDLGPFSSGWSQFHLPIPWQIFLGLLWIWLKSTLFDQIFLRHAQLYRPFLSYFWHLGCYGIASLKLPEVHLSSRESILGTALIPSRVL